MVSPAVQILGPDGRPIERAALKGEKANPTLSGVRSPIGTPPVGDFTPGKIGRALRAADEGDPLAYMELAERIEELDAHYLGVLATRKRSVAQLPISVDAASDEPEHVRHADMVRDWLQRDELQGELFDMLDAIGKGYSITEIIWSTTGKHYAPERLVRRPQTWFNLSRLDGETPLLRTEAGEEPLTPACFVVVNIQAKSGLPIRSGIARLALWHWMFKSFANRDWAIFTQSYGQPIRIGKYGPGATQNELDVLYRAVANIAGDCAALIPETMSIDFIETKNAGASSDLYRGRVDWLDQQMSKAVLGQTATTDAIAGGHAVGREHRQVQEDIERADAIVLAATLNRQLIRPWIDIEFGPQEKYPRLRIGREETIELKTLIDAVERLVPLGLKVERSTMADRLGLPDPDEGAELLAAPSAEPSRTSPDEGAGAPQEPTSPTLQAAQMDNMDAIDEGVAALLRDGGNSMVSALVKGLEAEIAAASSLADVEELLARRMAELDTSALSSTLARAAFAARISGEADEALS